MSDGNQAKETESSNLSNLSDPQSSNDPDHVKSFLDGFSFPVFNPDQSPIPPKGLVNPGPTSMLTRMAPNIPKNSNAAGQVPALPTPITVTSNDRTADIQKLLAMSKGNFIQEEIEAVDAEKTNNPQYPYGQPIPTNIPEENTSYNSQQNMLVPVENHINLPMVPINPPPMVPQTSNAIYNFTPPPMYRTPHLDNMHMMPHQEATPAVPSTGDNKFLDITQYLTLPQVTAAKKLNLPASTLSKRWKVAGRGRKWPYRTVCKLDKEIMTLLYNIPKDGDSTSIPKEIEAELEDLLQKRAKELETVVIRL
eukprot:TRINITY_DN9565_c0_g1_i1.p1 TRINITY_DN9565_c0_g1~~TRINITY_DN9565_c0_g1_i1.p1  ORF type:complete len:308 (-),score=74.74 TRINITY_DN9565_c0_g1_i1:161-1084(-)